VRRERKRAQRNDRELRTVVGLLHCAFGDEQRRLHEQHFAYNRFDQSDPARDRKPACTRERSQRIERADLDARPLQHGADAAPEIGDAGGFGDDGHFRASLSARQPGRIVLRKHACFQSTVLKICWKEAGSIRLFDPNDASPALLWNVALGIVRPSRYRAVWS
jgi:hypothetical protein